MNGSKKQGWVRLHRQIEENRLWFSEPFTRAQAWIDLFLGANHKDGWFFIRGNKINIKRGQVGWSELTMSSRWMWSRKKVRSFLKMLESEQQITQQKDRYITTIVTILNYERFQSDTAEGTAKEQQKNSRGYINKNDKKNKNDKEETSTEQGSEDSRSVINLFKSINPSYELLFKRKTEHDASSRLLAREGIERIRGAVSFVATHRTDRYCPRVSKPTHLEEKWAMLEVYGASLKINSKINKRGVII